MTLDNGRKILIVGLGQLGGGYAKVLSENDFIVGAIDINGASLAYAKERGWIQECRDFDDPEFIGKFDLVISGLYPHTFMDWISKNKDFIKKGALVTDVTGVKSSVVYPVQEMLPEGIEFIAAHPMAGREKSGVESANPDVFKGANYIVTPTEKNTPEAINTCKELGKILGFGKISELSPEEHDEIIAFLSQLTHCIAVALMLANDSEKLVDYTGDSFRDLTRIATINDLMWSELFVLNKEKLLTEIDRFSESLNNLRETIANSDVDKMRELMRISTERRKLFNKRKEEK